MTNRHELRFGFVVLDETPLLRLFSKQGSTEITFDCLTGEQARHLADKLETLPNSDCFTVTFSTGPLRGLSADQLADLIIDLRGYADVLDDCYVVDDQIAISERLYDLAKQRLAAQVSARPGTARTALVSVAG